MIHGGSDWSTTQDMIQEFYPWLHILSHECNLIVKDCFDEDHGIAKLVKLNEWMTDAQHWFSTHACSSFRKDQANNGEKTAFV